MLLGSLPGLMSMSTPNAGGAAVAPLRAMLAGSPL
jgi:hypothetical protein